MRNERGESFGELKMPLFTNASETAGYANLNAVGEIGELERGRGGRINASLTFEGDRISISPDNVPSGFEEGIYSNLGCETYARDLEIEAKPLGTGEQESLQANLGIDADAQMDLTEIETRFISATRMGLKASSQESCLQHFRKMAKETGLENYTKRQLSGPKGKTVLLGYISGIPKPSVRTSLSTIRRVWVNGMGLPWPIDNKTDIGKLPRVGRRSTPPDTPVGEWAKTLTVEKDPYLKLVWLLIAQHGWRPSHATGIRWSDIRYDERGLPFEILASGKGAEFKTYAPVAVRLAPDVSRALEEWRKLHPDPNGNGWILPYRGMTGKLDIKRRMTTKELDRHWAALQQKYGLPELKPKDLRHWVSTACRKIGLSKAASAYLQGHDAESGASMRDWYDNPQLEEIYQEQMDRFPNGPLGILAPIEVELIADIPPEAVRLMKDFFDGKLGSFALAQSVESLKMKMDAKPTSLSP